MIITTITELKKYVEVNASEMDFFIPSLRAAERRHLAPALGTLQYQALISAYTDYTAETPVMLEEKLQHLLILAQEVVANIGMTISVSRL